MELSEVAEMFSVGTMIVDDLPLMAINALEAGSDSPSLRQLAGAQNTDPESIRKLFCRALNELNISLPSPSEAALLWARRIAGDIVRGTITPYDGASKIWREIYNRFPDLKELMPFVGYASEYEDDVAHRNDYSRDIVDESKKFLSR